MGTNPVPQAARTSSEQGTWLPQHLSCAQRSPFSLSKVTHLFFCFSACHFFYSTITFHHFYQLGVDQHPPHASVREREGTVVQCSHIPWTIHHLENTSFREHIPRTTHPLKNTSLREHIPWRTCPRESTPLGATHSMELRIPFSPLPSQFPSDCAGRLCRPV